MKEKERQKEREPGRERKTEREKRREKEVEDRVRIVLKKNEEKSLKNIHTYYIQYT